MRSHRLEADLLEINLKPKGRERITLSGKELRFADGDRLIPAREYCKSFRTASMDSSTATSYSPKAILRYPRSPQAPSRRQEA